MPEFNMHLESASKSMPNISMPEFNVNWAAVSEFLPNISMPEFNMDWASLDNVNMSDYIYENSQDPDSPMQLWFVMLMQATTAAVAYNGLKLAGNITMSLYNKSMNSIFEASAYDASVDLDAPKPRAGRLRAFLSGAKNLAVSGAEYVAKKTILIGGTLAAVVNAPEALKSVPVKELKSLGLNSWAEKYAPYAVNSFNALKGLDAAQLRSGWDNVNATGAHYTAQGANAVMGVCASLHNEPGAWLQWGYDGVSGVFSNAVKSAWQFSAPHLDTGAQFMHHHTCEAVSTLSYGMLSAEGGEMYYELAALAVAAGMYWKFGPSIRNNNTNTNTNTNVVNIHTHAADQVGANNNEIAVRARA